MEEIINNKEIKNEVVKKNDRNTTLNLFEFIAACLIIFIHIEFPGTFGYLMNGIARFGVPLFFSVSGFYLIQPNMSKIELREKLKRRIFKIVKLLLFSFTIYFILGIISSLYGENVGFLNYLKTTFNFKSILKLVIINTPFVQGANWFMIAMIISYIIIYLFADYFIKSNTPKYVFSTMLMVWIALRVILCLTKFTIFEIDLSNGNLYRNWFANGLLFISFGMLLKQYEFRISKISVKLILMLLILSLIVQPLEYFIGYKFFNIFTTYYIGNILCVFTIIALSIKNPNILSNSKFINQKGNYTMFIYIFHPAIITIVNFVIKKLGLESNVLISWIAPIIVLILAVASAMIFNKLLCLIKDKRS